MGDVLISQGISYIFSFLRFLLIGGSFGLSLFLLGVAAFGIFNMFVPRPDFIYARGSGFTSSLIAFYYPEFLWGMLLIMTLTSGGMLLRGFKVGAAKAKEDWLFRNGLSQGSPPWWTYMRSGAFWDNALRWLLRGILFLYIAYQSAIHEWAVRPWFTLR
ncbi:hypothetical protein [Bradyrhizobium japonicum]|uniref:hypothetical protein n=1 Tax=Bradyrhizobium japonicum TaxID=375 RepID=UPI0004ADB50F|nr:hypothetical protein [Bradyrhizobium japonicum]